MAKINFTKSGIGVRGLRLMVGMPAHRPSAYSRCIGMKLKGKDHPAAPLGSGGKENVNWRMMFKQAGIDCRKEVPKVVRVRKTPIGGAY